jgi:L-asparaginase
MIRIVVTGGTFDKEYDMINGRLYFNQTNVNEMLQKGRCTIPHAIETLMMIDSLEMTDRDREKILNYCTQTQEERIVITHGTDTMTITGEYIAKANLNKTIVITGAMIPYSLGFSSDGMFNLGTSVAFAQSLPSGVYISMNGQYFEWNEVKKNKSTGYFERIEN